MKTVKRVSRAMKAAGVTLMLVSLALGLYMLLSGGANRNRLLDGLRASGVKTSVLDSLSADRANYLAMADAVAQGKISNEERAKALPAYFSAFAERAGQAEDARDEADMQAAIVEMSDGANARAFLESMESRGDLSESREITEAIAYLDSFAPKTKKKGKLAQLQSASCEEALRGRYESETAAHGDEAGSWYDFVLTVQAMVKADADSGETVPPMKEWLSSRYTWEAYAEALPAVRQAEKQQEQENLLDAFAAYAQRKANGEAADASAFFEAGYAALAARYGEEELPDYPLYVALERDLLKNESYDGTLPSTFSALREGKKEKDAQRFSSRLAEHCTALVASADAQAPIPAFSALWQVTARSASIFLLGLALAVLSRVLKWVLTQRLMKKRKAAGLPDDGETLLRVEHLKQYFRSGAYVNKAVDDVSFSIKKGEVFGLVGESGCGKTTTGRTIINLYDPTEGNVYFQGLRVSSTENGLPVLLRQMRAEHSEAVKRLREGAKDEIARHPEQRAAIQERVRGEERAMREDLKKRMNAARDNALESSVEKGKCIQLYREKRMAEVRRAFDEDRKTLTGEALAQREARFRTEMKLAQKDNIMTRMQMIFQDPIASINPRMTVREIISEGLVIRGVKDKAYIDRKVSEMLELVGLVPEHADRYPHEFSGGQRQRIGIARAIVMEPDLIIADEPISALDVSIQAQVINLLNDLREKMGLTILFIAHNLSVVKYFSDRIAVMYFGKIMELADSDELFAHPLHPYTKSLLSAIPYPDPHYEKQRVRVEYDPARAHDYSQDKPSLREIRPGHLIYCNQAEFERYLKELEK